MRYTFQDSLGRLRMAFEEHIELVRQIAIALDNKCHGEPKHETDIVTFRWNGNGYSCSRPGEMSGDYVRVSGKE